MERSNPPKWYVFLALPLLLGLFLLESCLALQGPVHQMAQITIVLFVFGLVYVYVGRESLRCCQDR